MRNESKDNPHTIDQAELRQAMLAGTDETAARQGALWSRIVAGRAKPRSLAGPLALGAAAVAVAAVLLLGLPRWLPQADIVRPMASAAAPAAQEGIALSANIQIYTPALSSVQGITITALDPAGSPVQGSWSASWGVFLGPVSEQGNLIPTPSDPAATLEGAARALWSFPWDSGDIPWNIQITFTAADGRTATMALERDREREGFVRVVPPLEDLNLRANINGYSYDPMRNIVLYLKIEAVDATANPVSGTWKASYGSFVQDEEHSQLAQDRTWVWWAFGGSVESEVPDEATITFTAPDGRSTTLHLEKDPDDPWAMRIVPEELVYIPMEPAETHPVSTEPTTPSKTRAEMPALDMENMATAELVRLEDGAYFALNEAQRAELLNAYSAGSAPGDDSIGTTPTLALTITRKDGSILRLWGPQLITWALEVDGKQVEQHNIVSERLRQWFAGFVDDAAALKARESARQVVGQYFWAWGEKDVETMNSFLSDRMRKNHGNHSELDLIEDITLLSCTDNTQVRKGAYDEAWYANPADLAIFTARFNIQYTPGAVSPMDNGENEMDFYLVKETADGPWVIVMWGNG